MKGTPRAEATPGTGRTLLVTGGLGFIGSAFVRRWSAAHPEDRIVNLDAGTYAADPARVAGADPACHRLVAGDVCDPRAVDAAMAGADLVVHFAAESHVDRSIEDATAFVRTNVLGTQVLLDAARRHDVRRFHHVSTDEVFGTLGLDEDRRFHEASPYAPRSPYAASKAGADHLVRAHAETYGLDVTLTNGSNNYGPFQHPEKFLPRMIARAHRGEPLPVYGDGRNVRDWLHVDDYCDAIATVLREGRGGQTYCVGGGAERDNETMARTVLDLVGNTASHIEHVPDRPGHDLRYAVDDAKIRRELGWAPSRSLEEGLADTVRWYLDHESWWAPHLRASEAVYAGRTP